MFSSAVAAPTYDWAVPAMDSEPRMRLDMSRSASSLIDVKIFSELVEAKFLISISSSMPVTITLLVAALAMLLASLSRSPCMSLGVLP